MGNTLLLSRNAAQSDIQMKQRAQYLFAIPPADAQSSTQVAYRCLGARAKTTPGHLDRPFTLVFLTTRQALQAVQLVFDQFRLYPRQFTHLVATRIGVFAQQQRVAMRTSCWSTDNYPADLFQRLQLATFTRMPFLTALFPPSFLRQGWGSFVRRVRRRRSGRGLAPTFSVPKAIAQLQLARPLLAL